MSAQRDSSRQRQEKKGRGEELDARRARSSNPHSGSHACAQQSPLPMATCFSTGGVGYPAGRARPLFTAYNRAHSEASVAWYANRWRYFRPGKACVKKGVLQARSANGDRHGRPTTTPRRHAPTCTDRGPTTTYRRPPRRQKAAWSSDTQKRGAKVPNIPRPCAGQERNGLGVVVISKRAPRSRMPHPFACLTISASHILVA